MESPKKKHQGGEAKETPGEEKAETFEAAIRRGATAGELRSLPRSALAAAVRQRLNDGKTLLIIASEQGDLEAVRFLVTEGHADVNQTDSTFGCTALWIACAGGYLEIVRFLVAEGHADVNHTTVFGHTPLWIACAEGYLEVVRFLVTQGHATVNQADSSGLTPLSIACKNGHLEVVRFLVTQGHVDVNQAEVYFNTPLYKSALHKSFGIVRVLARAGARLSDPHSDLWQREEVLRALVLGCQDRLRPLLAPVLESALVLPAGQGGLEPALLPCVLEYALPSTWEDVQEHLGAHNPAPPGFVLLRENLPRSRFRRWHD